MFPFMKNIFRAIRAHWNWSDTAVLGGNLVALGLFIGNCWWELLFVATTGALGPLILQGARARTGDTTLKTALVVGGVTAFCWPAGEWCIGETLGWWGSYLKTGYMVLDTPLYTVLIGWLGSAYCVYIGLRTREMGFPALAAVFMSGITGFGLGVLGENLFVGAGMWTYEMAQWRFWAVPAFIPVGYGIAYGAQPLFNRWPSVVNGLALVAAITIASVVLGLITGFFPR
jgi:hypothetical protein